MRTLWATWSNLPAQARSSQSTWHRIASRWFLNISREGESITSVGNLFQCTATWTVKVNSGGTSCTTVSVHCLLLFCSAPPRNAWCHPLVILHPGIYRHQWGLYQLNFSACPCNGGAPDPQSSLSFSSEVSPRASCLSCTEEPRT